MEYTTGHKSLSEIADKLRGIDIAFLSTKTGGGEIASRPMSNNGDVEYDGDSYYFTMDRSETVADIERDNHVTLAFTGKPHLFAGTHFYAAVEGQAELIRDKAAFAAHWTPSLDFWFKQGVDTPGIVLVKVHAERIKYWDGMESGEVVL